MGTYKIIQELRSERRKGLTMGNLGNMYSTTGIDSFLDDLFFKNDLHLGSHFEQLSQSAKAPYPYDIIDNGEDGLEIVVAAVGLDKKDIKISADNNVLTAETINDVEDKSNYIVKHITRKAFSLSWKLSPKLDMENVEITLDKGLLNIKLPLSEDQKPKVLSIK